MKFERGYSLSGEKLAFWPDSADALTELPGAEDLPDFVLPVELRRRDGMVLVDIARLHPLTEWSGDIVNAREWFAAVDACRSAGMCVPLLRDTLFVRSNGELCLIVLPYREEAPGSLEDLKDLLPPDEFDSFVPYDGENPPAARPAGRKKPTGDFFGGMPARGGATGFDFFDTPGDSSGGEENAAPLWEEIDAPEEATAPGAAKNYDFFGNVIPEAAPEAAKPSAPAPAAKQDPPAGADFFGLGGLFAPSEEAAPGGEAAIAPQSGAELRATAGPGVEASHEPVGTSAAEHGAPEAAASLDAEPQPEAGSAPSAQAASDPARDFFFGGFGGDFFGGDDFDEARDAESPVATLGVEPDADAQGAPESGAEAAEDSAGPREERVTEATDSSAERVEDGASAAEERVEKDASAKDATAGFPAGAASEEASDAARTPQGDSGDPLDFFFGADFYEVDFEAGAGVDGGATAEASPPAEARAEVEGSGEGDASPRAEAEGGSEGDASPRAEDNGTGDGSAEPPAEADATARTDEAAEGFEFAPDLQSRAEEARVTAVQPEREAVPEGEEELVAEAAPEGEEEPTAGAVPEGEEEPTAEAVSEGEEEPVAEAMPEANDAAPQDDFFGGAFEADFFGGAFDAAPSPEESTAQDAVATEEPVTEEPVAEEPFAEEAVEAGNAETGPAMEEVAEAEPAAEESTAARPAAEGDLPFDDLFGEGFFADDPFDATSHSSTPDAVAEGARSDSGEDAREDAQREFAEAAEERVGEDFADSASEPEAQSGGSDAGWQDALEWDNGGGEASADLQYEDAPAEEQDSARGIAGEALEFTAPDAAEREASGANGEAPLTGSEASGAAQGAATGESGGALERDVFVRWPEVEDEIESGANAGNGGPDSGQSMDWMSAMFDDDPQPKRRSGGGRGADSGDAKAQRRGLLSKREKPAEAREDARAPEDRGDRAAPKGLMSFLRGAPGKGKAASPMGGDDPLEEFILDEEVARRPATGELYLSKKKYRTRDAVRVPRERELKIGRSKAAAHVVLNHSDISEEHALIAYDHGAYYLTDCGSSNGTFLNGERIGANQSCEIKPLDEIMFSRHRYYAVFEEAK